MAFDYTKLKLYSVRDIEEIRSCITQNGNFHKKDYNRLCKMALNSEQHSRIMMRLKRVIKPMISIQENNTSSTKTKSNKKCKKPKNKEISKIISKTCRASELIVDNGIITYEGMSLKSNRIKKTHPSWLIDIDHEFKLIIDTKNKQFHFLPHNDLSFLLDAIKRNINEKKERRIKDEFEIFKKSLPADVMQFIINHNNDDFYRSLSTIKANGIYLYSCMVEYDLIDKSITKSSFIENLQACSVEIPFDDLKISDGFIDVHLNNARYIGKISWECFYNWMWDSNNNTFFHRWENEIREIFESVVENFLQSLSKTKTIRINTFMSRKTFFEAFIEKHNHEIWIRDKNAMYHRHLDYLTIPISYLSQGKCNGYSLLATLPSRVIDDYLTSSPYTFNPEVILKVKNLIAGFEWNGVNRQIYDII